MNIFLKTLIIIMLMTFITKYSTNITTLFILSVFFKSKSSITYFFVSNTTLSCVFLYFLIIDSYFLIPAVIVQICNPTAELATTLGIPNNNEK